MPFFWALLLLTGPRSALVHGATPVPATPYHPAMELSAADLPACARYRTEVRYGAYGYDHLVHLRNRCTRPIACVIRTNVRSKPLAVQVDPKSSATVVTYRGSPARRFEARVWCWKRSAKSREANWPSGFSSLQDALSW